MNEKYRSTFFFATFFFLSLEFWRPWHLEASIGDANIGALVLFSMAESTRSTVTSNRLEDALTKLTTHQLYLTHTIQQLTDKIDELIHHLPKPAPPSHSPSFSFAIPASHGCLSLYSDHA